jgi:flavin-dependent dehydrogenase
MPSLDRDVLVVGGGPAGSTVACLLKQYAPARRITILERCRFPRHHIGESALPEINRILSKMGVLAKIDAAGFIRKRGVTYKWAHDKPIFSEVFSNGVLDALAGTAGHIPDYSWQVDRSRYDQILLEHARERGVEVLEESQVVGVVRDDGRVRGVEVVRGETRSKLTAEFVVDCSGQARVLSSSLRLDRQAHALGDLAIFRYYRDFRWNPTLNGSTAASRIFFQATRAGWMWFIPIAQDLVSVGLVTRREFLRDRKDAATLFDVEVETLPEIRDMLEGATLAGAPGESTVDPRTHVISDWSYSHDRPAGPGYYLAGDAAAFVDPILSSGILLAHQSGLSVANAIHTEWTCPDIEPSELHEAYAEFYADLYGGFLRMAQWWYTRREVAGIDEWLKLARDLGHNALGSKEIAKDDASSFMTFAAGFLTDYRFVNVGCGFGDKGLADSVEGIEGTAAGGLRLDLPDRTVRFRRTFDRVEVAPYLVTDIDTSRWWRLPNIRFYGPQGDQTYRPPIQPESHSKEWVLTCVRAIERLIRACDGETSIEKAVAQTRDSFPPEDRREIQRLCDVVLAALSVKGLLQAA